MKEKHLNIFKRFWIYQSERFPVFSYGLMVLAFVFSAISYSKFLRKDFCFSFLALLIGTITSFGYFFLLRLFDEFKDAEDDAKYRPYRAVPRGLVSFKELKWLIFIIIVLQCFLNAIFIPKMLWIWIVVIMHMFIMAKEFFIRDWLRNHPIAYLISHMMIMPLFGFYATGLDWNNNGISMPKGLIIFLIITFLNGIVIEIGRKIRARDAEEVGVETYSYLWGEKNATLIWLCVLSATFIFANIACFYAGFNQMIFIFLIFFLILCAYPAIKFLKNREQGTTAKIETMAGIWTLGMYLSLGSLPMIQYFIKELLR